LLAACDPEQSFTEKMAGGARIGFVVERASIRPEEGALRLPQHGVPGGGLTAMLENAQFGKNARRNLAGVAF
jgi:hypothetical protein